MNPTCCNDCAKKPTCKGNSDFDKCTYTKAQCRKMKMRDKCNAECKDFQKKEDGE
jgi:hypothetical protein